MPLDASDFSRVSGGYNSNPAASLSLRAEAYTDPAWFAMDQQAVLAKSWQWVCHVEKVREVTFELIVRVVMEPFNCRLFDRSVHSFDLTIGPGVVEFG